MSSKQFDVTVKDLVEDAAVAWPEVLGPWPALGVDVIDADVATVSAADKVLRVKATTGDWLLDLEPEARHAAVVPERLQLYSTLLRRRHGLLVRSVALLLRREANASNLTGELRLQFPDEAEPYAVFRYRVVRVWELPLAPLLAGRLETLPLAPLTDEAESQLPAVIERLDERLRQEASREKAAKLRAATFVLLGLRYEAPLIEQLFRGITEMEESSTYQLIVSRGEAKGKLEEARKLLLRQGRKKFGEPDSTTLSAVESVTDLGRLEALSDHLLDVDSWQALLAGLPSEPAREDGR
jgi:predicted transposase YdaD